MKLGRLVLTHREDLVEKLKEYYLNQRTSFLVVACDSSKVNTGGFSELGNFRLLPASYELKDGTKTLSGRQWRVWISAAKQFPEIEGWVIHDYDFLARPTDDEIFQHIRPNEYGMIGTAFPVWQEGMTESNVDTYPFPEGYHHRSRHEDDELVRRTLMENIPVQFQGITTVVKGFSDFIATSRENILLLDDKKVKNPELHGVEHIPHTVWRERGIRPVDMRKHFRVHVTLEQLYVPYSEKYDMLNPVKYFPGQKADLSARMKNLKMKAKSLAKRVVGREGRRLRKRV